MGGMSFSGDWDKLLNLANVESALQNHMGDALEIASETIRANVVKGVRDQSFGFAPLSPKTVARKDEKGQSTLVLIAEGDYLASFTTERVSWDEVHIGTNHPQGRALEFGYEPGGLPARPHWEPGFMQSLEEVYEILQDGFANMFEGLAR